MLKNYLVSVFIAALGILPTVVNASIIINEISWMGDDVSANNEWIELYNDAQTSVSLNGWSLTDNQNLIIDLSGTVGAGDYAVLERTDDDSAPGSAFLIYTGSLTNTGATLTLSRDDGGTEDQVAGGENWQNVGGDNTTKETAQYTTAGWITALATPGKQNATEDSGTDDEDEEENGADGDGGDLVTGTVIEGGTLELPDVDLSLKIVAPTIGYVNQPIKFNVEPAGLGKTIMESLVYEWNFGDLTTGFGREVEHSYQHPGEYVVITGGSYARHGQLTRHQITILPVAFSITRNNEGDVQLHNNAKYEVNLSGFSLLGSKQVDFPDNTVIVPNGTITIPRSKVGRWGIVKLYDQSDLLVADNTVARVAIETPPTPTKSVAKAVETIIQPAVSVSPTNFQFKSENPSVIKGVSTTTSVSNVINQTEPLEPDSSDPTWPYLGLVGVISLAFGSLFVGKRKNPSGNQTGQV